MTTKKILRVFKYIVLSLVLVIVLTLAWFLAKPLWNHWVVYPRLQESVTELQQLRKEPLPVTDLKVFRGVMHLHSYLSHDSEGTLNDLIPAAKKNGIGFMLLTDHPNYQLDTFPKGYNGYYEGVLIVPGTEKHGFVAWPLDTTVIDLKTNPDTIAKNIVENGGLVYFSHTEQHRNWGNPWYKGMEIYNFHTDTKDEQAGPQIFNFLVNGNKYRIWALREMFDEQSGILARWDSLNIHRKVIGFSAVDTHENQNIRARYTPDGKVEWLGPNCNVIDTTSVNFLNRWLLSEPDANGWVFKWLIDTYMEGFDYIINYVFADTLSVTSLAANIDKGHLYSAFKTLGDAKGFKSFTIDSDSKVNALMGDSVQIKSVTALKAVSPLPGQFRLIHNGKLVDTSVVDTYEYSFSGPFEPGAWRIEVFLNFNGKNTPWIYANPVYLY